MQARFIEIHQVFEKNRNEKKRSEKIKAEEHFALITSKVTDNYKLFYIFLNYVFYCFPIVKNVAIIDS